MQFHTADHQRKDYSDKNDVESKITRGKYTSCFREGRLIM